MKEKCKKITKEKQTKTERSKGKRSYSKRVRAKWFCCTFKLGLLQLICKASLIFKSNLELAFQYSQLMKLLLISCNMNYPRKNLIYLKQVYNFQSNQIKFKNLKSSLPLKRFIVCFLTALKDLQNYNEKLFLCLPQK